MYKHLGDKMLFDYYMVHSTRTKDIFCTEPFYIESKYINKFNETAMDINSLVVRIIKNINGEFSDFKAYLPDFPLKDEIIKLKNPLAPIFWTRYDGFIRDDGSGVFYSELNYDKPCAEREILYGEDAFKHKNNINNGFRERLISNFYGICKEYFPNKKVTTAFLTDPCHYEETHLSMLLTELLSDDNHQFVMAGPTNLTVKNDSVYAFGRKVDVILKLFPTEFDYEINHFVDILKLFEEGKVLLLNDPRVIIGQCKNLYTYLWKLVNDKDKRLNIREVQVIRETLPYTTALNDENIKLAVENKDKYVIKPVYGRYSMDVFIGSIHTDEEWAESINYVKEKMKEKEFILQEFCKINSETVPYYDGTFTIPMEAFVNLGIFISRDKYIGTCTRWNESLLTSDETTWVTPIVEKEKNMFMEESDLDFRDITREAVIDCGFCGNYVKEYRYLNINPLVLSKNKLDELKKVVNSLAEIFKKTQKLILENIDLYADILGIEPVKGLLKEKYTDEFSFIARMDLILDVEENWKVLEINAETPAGLCESTKIDNLLWEKLKGKGYKRINSGLENQILNEAGKIIKDYSSHKEIKTLAVVGSTYYEDWYTFNIIYEIVKDMDPDIKVIIGSIYDMEVKDDDVYLYNNKVDCMFRYYPLDWFDYEETEYMKKIKELLNNSIFSLNPVTTIVSQSKAFFAAIYELLKQGFYTEEERKIIRKHIPFTTFDLSEMPTPNFAVKPLLMREGEGVEFSWKLKQLPEDDCVFQELVYAQTIKAAVDSNSGSWKENLYPVVGAYITGTEFAGVYTRLGSQITNIICMYAPMYYRD